MQEIRDLISWLNKQRNPDSAKFNKKLTGVRDKVASELQQAQSELVDKVVELDSSNDTRTAIFERRAEEADRLQYDVDVLEDQIEILQQSRSLAEGRLTEIEEERKGITARITNLKDIRKNKLKQLRAEAKQNFPGLLPKDIDSIRTRPKSNEIDLADENIKRSLQNILTVLEGAEEAKKSMNAYFEQEYEAYSALNKEKNTIEDNRKKFQTAHPRLCALLLYIGFISSQPTVAIVAKMTDKSASLDIIRKELSDLKELLDYNQQQQLSLNLQQEYLQCERDIVVLEEEVNKKELEAKQAQADLRHRSAIVEEKIKKRDQLLQEKSSLAHAVVEAGNVSFVLTEQISVLKEKIKDLEEAYEYAVTTLPPEEGSEIIHLTKQVLDKDSSHETDTASITEIASLGTVDTMSNSESDSQLTQEGRQYDANSDSGLSDQTVEISPESSKRRSNPPVSHVSMFSQFGIRKSVPHTELQTPQEYQIEIAEQYTAHIVNSADFKGQFIASGRVDNFYQNMLNKSFILFNNLDRRMSRFLQSEQYPNVDKLQIKDLNRKISQIRIYREAGESLQSAMVESLKEVKVLIDDIVARIETNRDFSVAVAAMDINFDELKQYLDLTINTSSMAENNARYGLQKWFARFELMSNPMVLERRDTPRVDLGMVNYSFQNLRSSLDQMNREHPDTSKQEYINTLLGDLSAMNDEIVQRKADIAGSKLGELYTFSFSDLKQNLLSYYSTLNSSTVTEPDVARSNFIALSSNIVDLKNSLQKKDKLENNLQFVEELISVASKNFMIYLNAQKGSQEDRTQRIISKLEENLAEFHYHCGETMHIDHGMPATSRSTSVEEAEKLKTKIETSLDSLSRRLPNDSDLFATVRESLTLSRNLVECSNDLVQASMSNISQQNFRR